jgi:hypothetical protein
MPNKINYIKPEMIHVNRPNTVKKPQVRNIGKPAPVNHLAANRMTVEERNERLKRVREYQDALRNKKNAENTINAKQGVQIDRSQLQENQTIDNGQIVSYGNIEPIWQGQTVYIIGGGPSLTGFDFNKLQGKNVIAVNKAYAYAKQPYVLYWTDSRFYNWYKDEINALPCMKVTSSSNFRNTGNGITILKNKTGKELNLECKPFEICAGNNSGYGAIHLAIKMGAKKIYLLGYDMQLEANKSHWHDGYPVANNPRASIYASMLNYIEANANIIKSAVNIYNTNRKSALKCFDFCTIDDALASS